MRQGLRIAFTGAGGTGKTTTAKDIAHYFELENMESAARRVYTAQNLSESTVREWAPDAKWELQGDIFAQKVEQDDLSDNYVADRSLLDHYAYCLLYCADYMTREEYMKYEALVRKHMRGAYTHVFYFPWGYWEAPDDGVRQQSPAWQDSIDALILAHIVRWGLTAIQVPQDKGKEFRSNFVAQIIANDQNVDIFQGKTLSNVDMFQHLNEG